MKIVTLGEIMLRLSTPGNTRFVQSDSFDVVYGGGEANVAVDHNHLVMQTLKRVACQHGISLLNFPNTK